MKYKLKSYKKQIEIILKDFDFEKVHETMKSTNWKYGKKNKKGEYKLETPSIEYLKKSAQDLLEKVIKEDLFYTSTGGFTALKAKKQLFLFFGYDSLISMDDFWKENE